MESYIEIVFEDLSAGQTEILVARLSELGYAGFEERENQLSAFVPASGYEESSVDALAASLQLSYSSKEIPPTNWNQVWESNFQPVVVDDFCTIRAEFHEPATDTELEIVITPKQSFGTGHHATTYMMVKAMREFDLAGKSVFDFGTGTGILAILAEMRGAREVLAIDHEDWTVENARENLARNGCSRTEVTLADKPDGEKKFDLIVANINRNVIVDNFLQLVKSLHSGGVLLLSGLLVSDEEEILKRGADAGLSHEITHEKENWICLKFR